MIFHLILFFFQLLVRVCVHWAKTGVPTMCVSQKKSLVWEQDRGKKATTSILSANRILHISQNLALTLTYCTWHHNNRKYFLVVLEWTTNNFFSFQTSFSLSVVLASHRNKNFSHTRFQLYLVFLSFFHYTKTGVIN